MIRPASRRRAPAAVLLYLATVGCGLVRYEPDPIDVGGILDELQASRERAALAVESAPLSLSALEALVVERDPGVREQVATFVASLALDRVRARLQDPNLGVGVNTAVGPDVDRRRVAPTANVTFRVPLSKRRSWENTRDLARVELEAARVDIAVRRALLDARSAYLEAAMAVEREAARAEIADAVRGMATAAEALARGGSASGLDLALLRLESARAEQALFNARMDREATTARLARALLVDPATLEGAALVDATLEWLGDREAIEALDLQATRTDLAAIRREHALAEAQLALEIARQVQDIGIGGSIGPEPAEAFTIIGVALSGALPIFRRNAQAIAVAQAERTRMEARYAIALDRARADREQALAAVTRALRRAEFLEQETLPVSETVLEAADRAVRAGTATGLAILSATRTRAEMRFQEITARQTVLRAWLAVERTTESPLLDGGATTIEEWPVPERIRKWREEEHAPEPRGFEQDGTEQ